MLFGTTSNTRALQLARISFVLNWFQAVMLGAIIATCPRQLPAARRPKQPPLLLVLQLLPPQHPPVPQLPNQQLPPPSQLSPRQPLALPLPVQPVHTRMCTWTPAAFSMETTDGSILQFAQTFGYTRVLRSPRGICLFQAALTDFEPVSRLTCTWLISTFAPRMTVRVTTPTLGSLTVG